MQAYICPLTFVNTTRGAVNDELARKGSPLSGSPLPAANDRHEARCCQYPHHNCKWPVARYSRRMTDDLTTVVLGAIERAPQWIRRDLDSKDRVVRIQAEESLAATIADALRKTEKLPT